jgi:hypothetical protein
MCLVSEKIKLCSCNKPDFKRHYWIFHRFSAEKNDLVIGEALLPAYIDPATDALNKNLLLQLLNQEDIFDFELVPQEKDRLQLSFLVKPIYGDDHLSYGFEFRKRKWRLTSFDYLQWMWHHEEEARGKIKNGLKRKRQTNEKV